MATMNGVVEELSQKDVTTRFGVKPTYSMKVNGTWIKCAFKKPPCNVGDTVTFEGNSGTYGMEGKDIIVTARGTGAPAPIPTAAPTAVKSSYSAAGSRVFPIPPLHGDRSIVRQNALARVTEIYIACRGGKPFELDEGSTKIVIALARKFESYTAGDLDMAEAKTEAAAEEDVAVLKAVA